MLEDRSSDEEMYSREVAGLPKGSFSQLAQDLVVMDLGAAHEAGSRPLMGDGECARRGGVARCGIGTAHDCESFYSSRRFDVDEIMRKLYVGRMEKITLKRSNKSIEGKKRKAAGSVASEWRHFPSCERLLLPFVKVRQ